MKTMIKPLLVNTYTSTNCVSWCKWYEVCHRSYSTCLWWSINIASFLKPNFSWED